MPNNVHSVHSVQWLNDGGAREADGDDDDGDDGGAGWEEEEDGLLGGLQRAALALNGEKRDVRRGWWVEEEGGEWRQRAEAVCGFGGGDVGWIDGGYHGMEAARERWEQCLAKLRASTRPDATAIEDIMQDLAGLPYPLDFCEHEADAVGNLLCDLCRLARLDSRVSLVRVSDLATTLTTKHSVYISEGNMQTIVTFVCSAIDSPEVDVRQRSALLRALSAILYGNGQRCANLADGLLKILLPYVTEPATAPSSLRGSAVESLEVIHLQRLVRTPRCPAAPGPSSYLLLR